MAENGLGRKGRSDARVRLEMLGIAAVLAVVVLGVFYLLVPPDWLEIPHLYLWIVPSLVIAAGVALAAAQHRLEKKKEAWAEITHLRELVE